MFPLLFREEESLVKVLLHLFYLICCLYWSFRSANQGHVNRKHKKSQPLKISDEKLFCNVSISKLLESLYLFGAILVFSFPYLMTFLMGVERAKRFEFLPLLNYSIYCACGNVYVFVRYYCSYLSINDTYM